MCCVSDWIKHARFTEENSVLNVLKQQAQSQKAKFKNAVLSNKKKSKEKKKGITLHLLKKILKKPQQYNLLKAVGSLRDLPFTKTKGSTNKKGQSVF